MRCLAGDLIGPDNAGDESRFKYVLTVIDMFSYWLWIVPLTANSAKDIAEAIHLHMCCDLGGWPAVLRSERGEFRAELFRELNERLGYDRCSEAPITPAGRR